MDSKNEKTKKITTSYTYCVEYIATYTSDQPTINEGSLLSRACPTGTLMWWGDEIIRRAVMAEVLVVSTFKLMGTKGDKPLGAVSVFMMGNYHHQPQELKYLHR